MAKEKKDKKEKKDGKDKKDGKEKDKKEGKDKDKKKGVTFIHERLTEPPPPRYPVGQEPPLPPWSIIWTSIGVCLESSIPGLSLDILTEKFNELARPGMSMAMVHPKDLAEDEMGVEGTILAELLKKEKEESNAVWPSSNLLDKCLKSRSVLDRDNEHRKEEVRRASALVEVKQASEDLKVKLAMAKEGVPVAESKLKEYRTKLLEEMWAKKAEMRLANKIAAIEVPEEAESTEGCTKQNVKKKEQKDKTDKKDKKGGKEGMKEDKDKQEDNKENGQKGKKGKDEPELAPLLNPQDQFKLLEEEVIKTKNFVKEVEAKLLKSIKTEAALESALLEPFTAGRFYCLTGMDSALPVIQLACEDKSFLKAVFNIAPRPKDSVISPESKETAKAKDENVSKREAKAAKKEAKAAKKEAKATAVATATPPLVAEIRALVENGSIMEPARNVYVVDVFYDEAILTLESTEGHDELKKQGDEVDNKKGKKEAKDKKGKKAQKGKEEQEVVGNKSDEEQTEKGKKDKKDKKPKKAMGARDESLPYGQIGQAVAAAFQRLLLQAKMYSDLGERNVRIFKVPEANLAQGKDHTYYDHLLDELPQGLVTVPIIVHCLLEQVAAYQCPMEDIKASDVTNMNRQIRNRIYNEFEKPGHPQWIGLHRDAIEQQLPEKFAKDYNVVEVEAEIKFVKADDNNGGLSDEKVAKDQEKMADAVPNSKGDKLISGRGGGCGLHSLVHTGDCTVHKSHDVEELTLRTDRTKKAMYNPYVQAKEMEENLNVTHEFDTVSQLSTALEPPNRESMDDSIDVARVSRHLSMLRATLGRWRFKMPGTPEYSEEKMGASLTVLQDLCDHFEEDEPKLSLEDALFRCKELGGLSSPPRIDIKTLQRYKKLMIFLDMIKEDKDVFPDLDIPIGTPARSEHVIKGPNGFDHVEYWCNNCLVAAKLPETTKEEPKEPLSEKELAQVKKEFEKKLVNDYEKRLLEKDQSPNHDDAFEQEMIEAGIFPRKSKEEEEEIQNAVKLTRPDLDPGVVKMWCAGCQSVFMPPPPPSLEEIWKAGERMRQEMERLAAREAQAVVDAKIEAWKRLEQRIRNSVLGRRHAEGFADRLMGEVYARAKLHLPFELLRYDREEDCMLTCLYAADTQRNVQEQIPLLMPFGDFCATFDPASGEPIRKRNEVYLMEPKYKQVLDERRYFLAEHQSLITCGLPAKTPVQYEPRATIYKDGNVIMLRAIKVEDKLGKVQEQEGEKGAVSLESLGEGDQGEMSKVGTMQTKLRKNKEKDKEGEARRETTPEKEAKRKKKGKKGKEEQDIPDVTVDLVDEPISKEGVASIDSLSAELLDSGRSVIACLKDGLIAVFFFAKDTTLHLQINIPAGGRTFEITSTGEVIFLPVHIQKEAPKPAMDISASTVSPVGEESVEKVKKGEKREPKGRSSPPKERGKSKQEKKTEDEGGKESELKVKSMKKDNEKKNLEKPEQEDKADVSKKMINGATLLDESVEEDKGEDESQLLSNLDLINNIYKKGIDNTEVSRCILPSGSVVSYRENGFSQVLCNNGNVSEYKPISKDTVGWVTTNNKGLCVLQDPPTAEPETNDEVVNSPKESKSTSKNGIKKLKDADKETQKEQDKEQRKAKDKKGTKQNGAKQDKKNVSFAEQDEFALPAAASNPELPPVQVERPHLQLPSKKAVEVFDPDSESLITTREDLVVVMYTNDMTVRVVQHADGTHIYSEVKEKIEEYNPSAGQICLEQIKEFDSSKNALVDIPPSSIESKVDPPFSSYNNTVGVPARAGLESISPPELGLSQSQQTDPGVRSAMYPKRHFSAQWHVRKEGFPHVHGNTKGGVAVEFSTTDGQYCVTWSRESGQISVLMPNGSMIYSCGNLVKFDASDGTKKYDPKQFPQNQSIEEGLLVVNTNGIYEFNLERANLTFTDNAGNGFRSSWGYKIEPIINGLLPCPPKLAEQLDTLCEDSELLVPQEIPPKAVAPVEKIGKKKKASQNEPPQVQPIPCNEVGLPLSPISESLAFDSDQSLNMTDPGSESENSTVAGPQSFVSPSEEMGDAEELLLGPAARLFVIHEGGFGFEIIHEKEFEKYALSKKFNKDCTQVRQVFEEGCALLNTFVTVEQKAKKLADRQVQAEECCRAPEGLKLWARKVSEFARRIKLRAIQTKLHKRTKCDWLQVNVDLPYLPRVISPNLLPVLPLSSKTNVVFRQIFEYPSFQDEQLPRMERILENYYSWQENAMILTGVEQLPDTRTEEVIKQAQAVAEAIRKVHAKKKLRDARDRAVDEVQHATEVFREIRDREKERLQQFEMMKNEMKQEGDRDWLEYKESKKGPVLCVHEPRDYVQTEGPYRPDTHRRLCYFKCEEGLQYILSLQYQEWLTTDPMQWSVEALPPFSYSYQGSNVSHGSGENDGPIIIDRIPPSRFKEEIGPKAEPPCLLSEWMRELEAEKDDDGSGDEGKMCWELIKPERKLLGPADWTPCFLTGFDDKPEEPVAKEVDPPEIKEDPGPAMKESVTQEVPVEAEEMGAQFPLSDLQILWSSPSGKEWEINHEAVQQQLELIPNFPGWRKAEWSENKNYLDVNFGTLLRANISSIGALRRRPRPPKDWSRQFLVVPDFLDFGTVPYGTISMKVLFLQNYHGTEPGRFRFQNLGPRLKFVCELGMVPPGLSRAVRIFFRASALGCFNREIKIITQYDVYRIPIFAEVARPEVPTDDIEISHQVSAPVW